MTGQGVPREEATADDFIQIRAALVRRLGGANEAIVWCLIHFRSAPRSPHQHSVDGVSWWEAGYAVMAEETGLSIKQARSALDRLAEGGYLAREQHQLGGVYDRTYSYRSIVTGHIDVPPRADPSAPEGRPPLPHRALVPSTKKREEEVEEESRADGGDPYTEEIRGVAERIAEMVRANGHRVPVVGKTWWQPVEMLVRIDGYTLEQIEIVARWATADSFWCANIRSTRKLRKQFSMLRAQRNAELQKRRGQSTVQHGSNVHEILKAREAEAQKAISS